MSACQVCGTATTAATCPLCGAAVQQATAPIPQAPAPTPQSTWELTPAPAPVPPAYPPQGPPPTRPPGRRAVPLVILIVVLAVAAAGAIGYFGYKQFAHRADDGKPPVPTGTSAAPPTSGATGSSPTSGTATSGTTSTPGGGGTGAPSGVTDEMGARQALLTTYAADRDQFRTDGRWVVQLSSKWVGIVDPQQTTKSGSHTFMALDIYDDYLRLKNTYHDIRLVQSTDFAKQYTYPKKPAEEPLWVMVYDPGWMRAEGDALAWCMQQFPGRTGETLKNVCYPRQARPPYTE